MARVPTFDRVKESLFALVRGANPRAIYASVYRGVVVSQTDQTVDVILDDSRIPGMSALPIQIGLPGATVDMKTGARVLVAFENADPAKPVMLLWEGAGAFRVSLVADLLELGVAGAADAVLLGSTYRDAQHELHSGLKGLINAFQGLAGVASGPLSPLKPFFLQAQQALEEFEAKASSFLSDIVRTG